MANPFDQFDEPSSQGNPFDQFDEVEKPKAGFGTAFKKALASAGNAMESAISLPAGALATYAGFQDQGDEIFRNMEANRAARAKWANPDNLETSLGQDVGAMALTLPAQIPGMLGAAGEKGMDLIQRGEPLSTAILATLADAGLNAAGMGPMAPAKTFLGRAAIGAAGNVAMGAGSDAITQALATKEETKKAYNPYDARRRAQEALVGGVTQGIMGERPRPSKTPTKGGRTLAAIDEMAANKKAPETKVPEAMVPEQLNLFDQFDERSPISPYQTEMAPDMWRVDENGIPIRADLSMEVQNMQQPLQRNLFGDELDVNFPRDPNKPLDMETGDIKGVERFSEPMNFRNDPENQRPLTEAIDLMPEGVRNRVDGKFAEGTTRQSALDLLRGEIKASPDLEVAAMDADAMQRNIMAASGDNLKGFNSKMRKQGGGLLIGNKKVTVEATEDGFVAKVGDKEIGFLRSNLTPEQRAQLDETANVDMVKVDDAFKGKGVGKALYDAWTKANEGRVAPSGKTSPAAWKLWKRDNPAAVEAFATQEAKRIADGADEGMVLGNITDPEVRNTVAGFNSKKQSGGVLFDWKKQPEMDQLKKVAGIRENLANFIPSNATPDDVIAKAKTMPDVDQNIAQRGINNFTKGGLYQAEKTNNPIVKFTVDQVLNADRKARADVRDYIHDSLAPAMRDLSKSEMTEIAAVLNHADKVQVEITPDFLRQQGFNEKQVRFAETHRQTMDASFEAINRAREAAGLKPISKRTAYSAMNFTGDYRKLVYKLNEAGEKEVVGAIGAKTSFGLNSIEKQIKKANPEYIVEAKPRYMGGNAGEKGGSAVAAVQHALELLSENNPATKDFLDLLDEMKTQEAYSYLNAKDHTKAKKGVFGAEGRKPWESVEQNAKDFMDAQLQYAEAALKWGHLSDAANQVKQVLASDVDMPNAKEWSESYLQNALGLNPSEAGRGFENAVNKMWKGSGIGQTIPRNVAMYSRKAVNTMLLGLNPAFLTTNVIQPMLSMPAMTTFLKGRGIDTFTTGYDSFAKAGFTLMKEQMGKLDSFEKAAQKYADENHVFGSDLVDTSNISRKNAEFYLDKAGNFLASNVESGTRKLMYYGFVHMLKENGLGNDFGLAQNLIDIAMNNYSPVERPKVFNALGTIGDMAANLSSYKHNELSRLAMFAREIGNDGNAAPFLMQIATSVAAAGVTGALGFQEADWLYRQITKAMGKPDSLTRVVIDFSEELSTDAKNKYIASHGVFSALGVDMSKRLGISDVIPNSLGEAMFPGGSKLVDVGAAGLSAMGNPDEMNLKRLAREAAPGVMTGPMDREWFSKQTPQGELAVNRRTLEGQVIRNEADKMAKNIGFTGINESVQKQKLYDLQQQGIGYQELRQGVFKKMVNQMYASGKVDPQLIVNYGKYEGDMKTLETALIEYAKKSNVSMVDLAKLRAIAARSLPQQRQGQRVMEAFSE